MKRVFSAKSSERIMTSTARELLDGSPARGVQLPAVPDRLPEIMDPLERFAGGDVDAFEILFRQYQSEVYGWIVRIVRNPPAAEDLTIETFWRIYRHRKRFDPGRPFGPWVRRIATRVAIDYLKSTDRLLTQPSSQVALASEADPLRQREIRTCIEKVFCSLPSRLRVTAILALIEERPYLEIAQALEISTSAVKMRVSRAVRRLRAGLERMGIRP
jgi:RNA polymerase sigma-70 factor (ECF subfamily)